MISKIYLSISGVIFTLILSVSFLFPNLAVVQAQTAAVTNTPISTISTTTPVITPSPTQFNITFDQALDVYREISVQTVQSSQNTIELAKWLIATVISLTLAAIGGVIYITNQSRIAQSSATRAADQAEISRKKLEEAQVEISNSFKEISKARTDIERLSKQMRHIESNDLILLETINMIRDYTIKFYSDDKQASELARTTLIEFSQDTNPLIRYECIKIFETLPDYYPEYKYHSKQIVTQLQRLEQEDQEAMIRLTARKVLNKFQLTQDEK